MKNKKTIAQKFEKEHLIGEKTDSETHPEIDPMHKIFSGKKLSNTINNTDSTTITKPGFFKQIFDWSMRHFFITFIILYCVITFSIISKHKITSVLAGTLLLIYTIIYLSKTIRTNIYKFVHNELGIKQILVGYVSTILSLIGLFAIVYWGITASGIGYLKYGSCNAETNIDFNMINQDIGAINDALHYAYFSAMTFLTVGYGDICTMGAPTKIVAMIEALFGNIFTLLILAIAMSNYSFKKSSSQANTDNNINNKDNKK